MNQPTPITVKNYMGRPENPKRDQKFFCDAWKGVHKCPIVQECDCRDFQKFEDENPPLPCPSIANTEPGGTVLAELKYRERKSESSEWEDCVIDGYDPILKTGYEHQLYWNVVDVPIVEQKEGEGKPNAFISIFLQDNQFKLVEGNNHYANDYCGVVINEKNIEVANNNGDVLYSHDLNIYWLVGVLTWYGYLPRNYNKV